MSVSPFTHWRKSSYSPNNSNCVEVSFADWHKSSYSPNNSECVEVAGAAGLRGVRDSKLGEASPVLAFTGSAFAAFLRTIEN